MGLLTDRIGPRKLIFAGGLVTGLGYKHRRIHHATKVYVLGDIHTNTVECFWSQLKRSISGVYHAVSDKYLQNYLNEFTFRYNHRGDVTPMFQTFLARIS